MDKHCYAIEANERKPVKFMSWPLKTYCSFDIKARSA